VSTTAALPKPAVPSSPEWHRPPQPLAPVRGGNPPATNGGCPSCPLTPRPAQGVNGDGKVAHNFFWNPAAKRARPTLGPKSKSATANGRAVAWPARVHSRIDEKPGRGATGSAPRPGVQGFPHSVKLGIVPRRQLGEPEYARRKRFESSFLGAGAGSAAQLRPARGPRL